MSIVGRTFTHDTLLDPEATGPVRLRPKAIMRVTRVARGTVWFGYATGGPAVRTLPLDVWRERYGDH